MTSIWEGELKRKLKKDKTAGKDLTTLSPGESVYCKPKDHHRGERWSCGEVLEEVTARSYVVQTQDGLIRRNRSHLRPTKPSLPSNLQPSVLEAESTGEVPVNKTPSPVERPVQTYRYGRPIRPPKRLDL